jgi:hypothetical protein
VAPPDRESAARRTHPRCRPRGKPRNASPTAYGTASSVEGCAAALERLVGEQPGL